MAPHGKPPGKTFNERWPDEVADSNYLAGPWFLFILAGLLGFLGVPLILGRGVLIAPLLFVGIFALFMVVTIALNRATGRRRRLLARAWKVGAWIFAAAALGLAIDLVSRSLCDDACRAAALEDPMRSPPALLTYLMLIGGTAVITILVDRWGTNLRRRPLLH